MSQVVKVIGQRDAREPDQFCNILAKIMEAGFNHEETQDEPKLRDFVPNK